MLKLAALIFLLFAFFSCGKNSDEIIDDAILSANISLGTGYCQEAIDTLEGIGRKNYHAYYLKTLASAYACRAGYSTTTLFVNDISKTASPAPLGGLATYSTSQVTSQNPLENDASFQDLQTAIEILLHAGGIPSTVEPTTSERKKYFSSSIVGDIDAQILYMELVQLGKFFYVYGNANAAGAKGQGNPLNNQCLTSYNNTSAAVQTFITTSGKLGSCNSISSSNTQLVEIVGNASAAVTRKRRLCQGVVLLNGVIALFPSLIASALPASQQAAANAAVTLINNAKTALNGLNGSLGIVLNTQSQALCEDNTNVPIANLETFYAGLVETVFL